MKGYLVNLPILEELHIYYIIIYYILYYIIGLDKAYSENGKETEANRGDRRQIIKRIRIPMTQ